MTISGVRIIEMMIVAVRMALVLAVEDAGGNGGGVEHEGELAALRHQHGPLQAFGMARPEQPGDHIDQEGFGDHVADDARHDELPVGGDDAKVDRHADAEEEQAEQDAAERLDVGFKLMAETRFGKQHARQECAHGHRKTGNLHGKRRTEHDEQRRRRHHLARAGGREHPEERIEQIAPGQHQRHDGTDGDADGKPAVGGIRRRRPRAEQRDDGKQRHDGKVLEEQDRDDALPLQGRHRAPLLQHLHDDGGRGEHEAGSGDEGGNEREAERHADAGQRRHRAHHLDRAEPEDVLAHAPEPGGLHFQPDDEEEHHHAEFGDMDDRLRIGKETEAEGTDREPRGEIAEHRAEPDLLEDRHGRDACRQEHDDLGEIICIRFGCQGASPVRFWVDATLDRQSDMLPRFLRNIAVHALLRKLTLISGEEFRAFFPEFPQIGPRVDTGIMKVVEADAHGIVAGRRHGDDRDIAFSRYRHLLARPVALHLRRGREHTQEFGRKIEAGTVVEGHDEALAVLRHTQFGRPEIAHPVSFPSVFAKDYAPDQGCARRKMLS
jgi:hypothetical protein